MSLESMGIERRDFARAGAATAAGAALAGLAGAAGLASASEPGGVEARLQELEDRLWVCEAKDAIRVKLYCYARGDDRQDPELGASAFAEDSYVDYGVNPLIGEVFKGQGRDWAVHCASEIDPAITERGGYYAHVYANMLIYVNGEVAGSETYSLCPNVSLGDDGAYFVRFAMSRHCDKWNYIDGEWCIVEREAATDYNFAWTLDSCAGPYENAKMGRDDFSYRFLEYGQTGEARQ